MKITRNQNNLSLLLSSDSIQLFIFKNVEIMMFMGKNPCILLAYHVLVFFFITYYDRNKLLFLKGSV